MNLDSKQRLLYAIYSEYQKDLPDMMNITYENLDMDKEVFIVSLIKLRNEGLIEGVNTIPPGVLIAKRVKSMNRDNMIITREGINYVENRLEIDSVLSGQEKLTILKDKFGKLGWLVLKEVVNKILISI